MLGGFFAFLAAASPAWAQFTVVSGTVTDPNGLPYANGIISAKLITTASPTLNGLPYTPPTNPVGLDTAGSFTMRLADNAVLLPAATQWQFTVSCGTGCIPPASGLGPLSFTPAAITITGASQSITTQLNASAPALARIAGSSLTGSTNTWTGDQLFKSGNPWIDVQAYGARAIDPNVSFQTTATMSAGSATATLAAVSIFQNGDGVMVTGAGAANTLATPVAPTVTPGKTAGGTGTGLSVASTGGATTYNYQIVLRNKKGARTAASPVGTTATGAATLGLALSVSVTSSARAGTTVTVTCAATCSATVGEVVHLSGSTDASFSGYFLVASVTDATHFTYTSGMDTAFGATTSSTGGTVQFYVQNCLTLPAYPAGGWEYYIYGRTGAALTLIGVSRPLETTWCDFGSPYMDGIVLPSDVPTAAPQTLASAEPLVTTITAGAGTTTLTLANSAITAVTAAVIKFDNAPNILTAANAAAHVTGTRRAVLYFSPNSDVAKQYVVNSYLTLPALSMIWQAGPLYLNETVEVGSSTLWYGDQGGSAPFTPQFGFGPRQGININAANPGLYVPTANSVIFRGLGINVSNNQGLGLLTDAVGGSAGPISFYDMSFSNGTGSTDYMGMGLVMRGAFVIDIRDCTFIRSGPTGFGSSLTPMLLTRNDIANATGGGGAMYLDHVHFSVGGIVRDATPNIGSAETHIKDVYTQALRMPFLSFTMLNTGGHTTLDTGILDTSTVPWIANWSNGGNIQTEIRSSNGPSSEAGGTPGVVSGNFMTRLTFANMAEAATQAGQSQKVRIDFLGIQVATLVVNGGTSLTRYARFAVALSPAAVAANTCAAQSFTVTGIVAADILIGVNKPTEQAGLSVTPGHITGANTATANFCNNTAAPITPTAAETYQFTVVQ